jgi:hypothetical protein
MNDEVQQGTAVLSSRETTSFAPILGESGQGLLKYLVEQREIPDGAALRDESLAILSDCAAPNGPAGDRTGLVCGFVQSGKTMSIEMVSALAKDNGFRLIVLIAGITTNLVDQSVDRTQQHLRLGAGGYDWVMLQNPRDNAQSQLESLVDEWRRQPRNSRMLFVTVMKNVLHLRPLAALFRSVNLRGIPALVFDDEADQASLNTRPTASNPSPVYAAIEELRSSLPHHTLLQYTATPQAPLLISRIDSLSADFAELVSPGPGYAGGRIFFVERRHDLVESVPNAEIFDHTNLPLEPPDSLIGALQVFFVGVAAKYAEVRSPLGHRSMLVHPHQRREVHNAYLGWVNTLSADWRRTLSSEHDPDRPDLIREFRRAYEDLARTVQTLPSFEEVESHLPTAISRAITTLVNSDNGHEIPWSNGYAHILVGGEKLSRGYTVKGLTVTYMPRGPGGWTADTIQQRARFFGYHAKPTNNYLDYCRVYLHSSVLAVFEAYVEHEEDMRRQIARHRGQRLQELKRAFFLDASLRPTRRNIMRKLYQRPRLSSGWFEQQAPQMAPLGGTTNRMLASSLAASLRLEEDEFERHYYADVNLSELLENFLIPFACPYERDEIAMCAIRLILANEAESADASPCRVIFMDLKRRPRERRVVSDVIDLMQGRSSSSDPDRYPGDRAITANVPDRVTIQIHTIRAVSKAEDGAVTGVIAENVPALAIYLPRRLARDVIAQPNN